MNKKILILVNHEVVIYNFRKELVEKLLDEGYEVVLSCPRGQGDKLDKLVEMGCKHCDVNINRHGTSIIEEIKLLRHYHKLIKQLKPDVVLTYTIKPNIYGGLASWLNGIPYITTITGLGNAIQNPGIVQKIVLSLYRFVLGKSSSVFFQNRKNLEFMKKNRIDFNNVELVPGSGVNTQEFSYLNYPKEKDATRILYVGRIMKDKGIDELLTAIRIIEDEYQIKNIHFDFLGFFDGQYEDKFSKMTKNYNVHYYGQQNDVKPYLNRSHAVILPSYHEGMSNSLLEGASCGRPLLASNIPGCKEIIEDQKTGYLFEVKNAKDIVEKILKFQNLEYSTKLKMGQDGRRKVVNEFERSIVVDRYIRKIGDVIHGKFNN